MKHFLLCLILLISLGGLHTRANGGRENLAVKADRAQEILQQARAAVGGDDKLSSVSSLSVSAKLRRVSQGQETSGELGIEVVLPDKFRKVVTTSIIQGLDLEQIQGLDGASAWHDVKTIGGAGANVQVRTEQAPGPPGQNDAERKELSSQFARLMIGWLLAPPSSYPVTFKYAGTAQAPDGSADVLDAQGPDGFTLRLFLDKSSHLLIMMTYKGPDPAPAIVRHAGGEAPPQRPGQAPSQIEIQCHLSNYRSESGINFPHTVVFSSGGQIREQWDITNIKVNPSLSPGDFQHK